MFVLTIKYLCKNSVVSIHRDRAWVYKDHALTNQVAANTVSYYCQYVAIAEMQKFLNGNIHILPYTHN